MRGNLTSLLEQLLNRVSDFKAKADLVDVKINMVGTIFPDGSSVMLYWDDTLGDWLVATQNS